MIGIIGGGASGMAAALAAAENADSKVILFERQARVGKKLLATGNGRCNLSNVNMNPDFYYGTDRDFAKGALTAYSVEETLDWFASIGLMTVTDSGGRVYPYSDQANSVVDVLRFALEKDNIQVMLGFEVSRISKVQQGFVVESREETVFCDRVIIACGGLAGTKLGGSMSGYQLLRSLGHHICKLRPSLVQLKTDWKGITALKGIRANCRARILRDGNLYASGEGEIQFTDYGISGPLVFELSRDVCQEKGKWVCEIDFLPDVSVDELRKLIKRSNEEMLTGILHNRLGKLLAKAGGYDPDSVCALVKRFEISLSEPMGMDHAQVTAGGAITAEFDIDSMESKLVSGLYACGEVLDIDGKCGGYNLQWAWSSGRCAGHHAGGVVE